MFETNPQLARGLVSLFLQKGSKVQRKELVNALEMLPVCLPALECLNDVVGKTRLLEAGEMRRVVCGVLERGIRGAEMMATGVGVGESGERGGGGGGAMVRQHQSRQIKLLCLFVQSLLRNEVVGLEEVYYQIQGIGVKFMFVKEARELWRAYCAQ